MADQNVRPGSHISNSGATASSDSLNELSQTESRPQGLTEPFTARLRSASNPHSPHLDRVHSAKHLDDQSVYHSDQAMTSDEDSLDVEKTETIQEVRNGIVNERDVDLEKGREETPGLQKAKSSHSTRSRQDAKLVRSRFISFNQQCCLQVSNFTRWIGMARQTLKTPRTGPIRRNGLQPSPSHYSPSYHLFHRQW